MKCTRRFSTFLFSLSLVSTLAGCQVVSQGSISSASAATTDTPVVKSARITATQAASLQPDLTATAGPSATLSATQTATPNPLVSPQPGATSSALRFVFPTSAPQAVSAWRPPLYDIPWAISPNDHYYFARPISANVVNWPLADYRYGASWLSDEGVVHTGVDIDAPKGTAVMAAGSGKVIWVGYGLQTGVKNMDDPYGLAIAIMHDFGYKNLHLETVYAHLSEADVVLNQQVTTGQVIGKVGDTGHTTGPHLHFEVRVEGQNDFYTTRNPELWLVPPQGWGVLVGKIMLNSWTPLYQQSVTVQSKSDGNSWVVNTYAQSDAIHGDDYYNENMVLSDLPAGDYTVSLTCSYGFFSTSITINPGMTSYLYFTVPDRFSTTLPTDSTDSLFATPSLP